MFSRKLIPINNRLRTIFQLNKSIAMSSQSNSKKRVAIVGAGISGLLAHRELSEDSCSSVIFEATQPGGLWNADHGRMWDSLRTNLSKYTCVVSDLDWPENTDVFPTKSNVASYISKLSDSKSILANTKVTSIELLNYVDYDTLKYKISYENSSKEKAEEIFDAVIISSGFFSKSSIPNVDTRDFSGTIIGSDEYRNYDSFKNKKVVVVGGSFSGCEIAAEVAKVAAEVHHVVSSHAYVVPTYLPEDTKSPATAFLPIDTVLYRLSDKRLQQIEQALLIENSPDNMIESVVKTPVEDAATHQYFESIIGPGNDIFQHAGCPKLQKARIVISNEYRRMVKSGKITMYSGKLKKLTNSALEIKPLNAEQNSTTDLTVVNMAADACILATGFRPDFDILSEDIQRILGVSADLPTADAEFSPFLLDREIMHPDLPGMYFVGMYKGPYFGVVELQSKLIANYISGSIPLPSRECMIKGVTRAMEIRDQRPRPHFPHPDYVGMMFDYARELGKIPSVEFRNSHRYITPHYFSGRENVVTSMERDLENSRQSGKYVAKFVYEALENESWSFNRLINDRKSNSVMQVAGKVTFTRIDPEGKYLLYKEEGKLKMPNGYEFDASHYYVYHYNFDQDTLDIFFSTVGKPEVIDRPFISMGFSPTPDGWESKAYHLCGCDNYNAKYFFQFQGLSIPTFEVLFDVEGPQKDYQSTTKFERFITN